MIKRRWAALGGARGAQGEEGTHFCKDSHWFTSMPGFSGALAEACGGLCSGVRLSRQGGHAGSAGDPTAGS